MAALEARNQQKAADEAALRKVMPGKCQEHKVMPDKFMPGKVTPGKVIPGKCQENKVMPGKVMPGKVTPGKVSPNKTALETRSPVAETKSPQSEETKLRTGALRRVFKAFDLNGDGTIDKEELLALGRARRLVGQRQTKWTMEKSAALLEKMDTDRSGRIDMAEFVRHFEQALPDNAKVFETVVDEFMDVAASCKEVTGCCALQGHRVLCSARATVLCPGVLLGRQRHVAHSCPAEGCPWHGAKELWHAQVTQG